MSKGGVTLGLVLSKVSDDVIRLLLWTDFMIRLHLVTCSTPSYILIAHSLADKKFPFWMLLPLNLGSVLGSFNLPDTKH